MRDLLFVNLNGPPLEHFNAEKYTAMWIKDGRHSASDEPNGRKAPDPDDNVHRDIIAFIWVIRCINYCDSYRCFWRQYGQYDDTIQHFTFFTELLRQCYA